MTSIDGWLSSAVGRRMNPDGRYGLQCVDAVDLYAEELFGVPWPRSVGGVAGARQLLDVAPDEFWIRIDYAHGLVPQRGDVLVYAGDQYNQWGHTAVVESADQIGINVIQQDGFAAPTKFVDGAHYSDKPAHRVRLAYRANGTGPLAGWLRPRPEKIIGGITAQSTITKVQEDDMPWNDAFDRDVRGSLQNITNEVRGLSDLNVDVRGDLANKGKQLAALTAATNQLAALLAEKQGLSVDDIKTALASAIADGIKVTVEVK